MSSQKTEIAVGGVVLAAALGFAVYMGQATGFAARTAGYELTASFRSIEGITVGTDVRLAGVKIGSVTDISLNPDTFRADAAISVQDNIILPDDSAIVIASEGLLGGNFVEVLPGGSPFNLEAGDEIEDTQGAVSLISLLLKFVSGSGEDK
ncbi:outer membrane lipid asymmetry maintenance protein MlaD [Cognatishimia sp. WU-CL00825]|uniref:outer membrane lipid asymmetry maintenance protein MlaD n=1 Tax=Cognatishimia sp. WU-CL00825 TaxID=3127658 RepID=UPI003109614F